MSKKIVKIPRALSIFTLAMVNLAAVSNVKNWPFTAEYGFSSLFYFILASLIFFFPCSLVSAELATGWPKKGGIYLWVKEAFGPKVGFLAVWLQWIENIVYYPTILSFTASTVAFIFNPDLASNVTYTVTTVLILFWAGTLVNMFGMRLSGKISDLGGICGTLIPGAIVIVLGLSWIFSGAPLEIDFSVKSLIPDFSLQHMVFFTGVMLAFAGMEMSAVHALDVRNPQRNYPRAILLSAFLILIPAILGSLSIAMVVPQKDINLTAGTMQAFTIFLSKYNLNALIAPLALLMALGLFGTVSTWIIGPCKGLLAAGQEGHLPPVLHKTNKYEVPVPLLLLQGILGSAICLTFVLMPTVSSGFWILTVLVAQLYLVMYVLMFAAAIKLRYSKPNVKRAYQIPGGKFGIWVVCGIGILGSIFALLIGYLPPTQIEVGNRTFYTNFLLIGTIVGCVAPAVIMLFKKPSWNIMNKIR